MQDDFYNGDVLDLDLVRHDSDFVTPEDITIAILPLRPDAPILLPEGARPATPTAALLEATLIPVHRTEYR